MSDLHLVSGSDPTLRVNALERLVDDLLGEEDRGLALEDYTVPAKRGEGAGEAEGETPIVTTILTALASPPFMTARRVVVVREIGGLAAAQATMVAESLDDPVDGVSVVLVAGGGRTPAAIDKIVKARGETHSPDSEKTSDVLVIETREQHVKLTSEAKARVSAHFGEDAGRVPEFIELLHGAFGEDAVIDLTDVEPYLGEAGTVPRYELTGAIDKGDSATALEVLHRLLNASSGIEAKPLHPMQVMASLVPHYQRMLALDDPNVVTKEQASEVLGGRVKPYPAQRALEQSRRLGTDGLREAFAYLAQAELDLRGASGVPEDAVIQILVARLASLSRRKGAGASAPKAAHQARRR